MNTASFPAVVHTASAAPHLSERYVHVNTEQVIKDIATEGFVVANVSLARVRRRDPLFARHMVDFRHEKDDGRGGKRVGDCVPRFLFVNSHDGTTRASVTQGVYRFVCANGMVMGRSYFQESMRHSGEEAKGIITRILALAKNTAPLFDQIREWEATPVTDAQAALFARLATTLRFGDPGRVETTEVLQIRRREDEAPTFWNVFNRVQEATTSLSIPGVSATGRATKSRPLNQISKSMDYNRQLWQLGTEFVEQVRG